jgi:hypothetical protein
MESDSKTEQRRSERVLLQLQVTVEVEMPDGKPLRQHASTLVVSAHGGLLEIGRKMSVGEGFLIFNPKTGMKQACQALRVERSQHAYFAVAFEFDGPAPHFWPIVFPPANWAMVPS